MADEYKLLIKGLAEGNFVTTPNPPPWTARDHQPTAGGSAAATRPAAHALTEPCPPAGLLAPQPKTVHLARAYPTAHHAIGVYAFLWEARQHPMPDRAAIEAVIIASDLAQQGAGEPPPTMEGTAPSRPFAQRARR